VRRALAQQDGPTLLVGHSYAGMVISEATDVRSASCRLATVCSSVNRPFVMISSQSRSLGTIGTKKSGGSIDLADVMHTDWIELQREVTVLRAPDERREEIAKAINWRKR
jgi:hypothetical protein